MTDERKILLGACAAKIFPDWNRGGTVDVDSWEVAMGVFREAAKRSNTIRKIVTSQALLKLDDGNGNLNSLDHTQLTSVARGLFLFDSCITPAEYIEVACKAMEV